MEKAEKTLAEKVEKAKNYIAERGGIIAGFVFIACATTGFILCGKRIIDLERRNGQLEWDIDWLITLIRAGDKPCYENIVKELFERNQSKS